MKRKKEPQVVYQGPERRKRHAFLPMAIGVTGGVALATVAFWFFKEQAERVVEGRADVLDEKILALVHRVENKSLSRYLHGATWLGTHPGVGICACITAVAMMRSHRRHDAWTVIASTGGAIALATILKEIFRRQRPQEIARRIKLPTTHSFPSGHSLLSAATFPIIAHHLAERRSRPAKIVIHTASTIIILSVGFSRIYFGVHFPSDVLAGFSAGLGWLGLTSLSHTLADRDRLPTMAEKRLAEDGG